MRWHFLLSLILLVGCTTKNATCGSKALLFWPDAQGKYSFQEVGLTTLSTPYRLQGSVAEIFYENGLDDSTFTGSPAEPKLTNSNGVCVPEDAGSSLAVNVYAQFERLFAFELELGTAGQLTWPRKVGVETRLIGDAVDVENNAHYYGDQDVITLVPYSLGDVPVAINQGIVAHEHFHAHFQAQVVRAMNQAMPLVLSVRPNVEDLSGTDLGTERAVNNFVLRGWNEGLADFFAAVYTGRPDFFDVSVKQPDRRLDGPLAAMMSGDALAFEARGPGRKPGSNRVEQLTSVAYGQGSILARLLYALAQSGVQPPREFLKQVMMRLDQLPDLILPGYQAQVMDFEKIVPLLLRDFPVSGVNCRLVSAVASKGLMQKEFPQCSN